MRSVAVFVKGPGAGRESALRALQTAGFKVTLIRDVTPDPAQRLPSAEAPPRLSVRGQNRMARYIGPVCKLCRREGMKLYLKGERCYTEKCAVTRRPYPPGQHGQGRIKLTEYAVRLREKQKMRRIYGVLERQFRALLRRRDRAARAAPARRCSACSSAASTTSCTASASRSSRAEARQLVRHNHVLVNGKRVNIPSYVAQARRQDRGPREEPQDRVRRGRARAAPSKRPARRWLEVDKENFAGMVKGLPVREELNEPAIREQLRRRVLLALSHVSRASLPSCSRSRCRVRGADRASAVLRRRVRADRSGRPRERRPNDRKEPRMSTHIIDA